MFGKLKYFLCVTGLWRKKNSLTQVGKRKKKCIFYICMGLQSIQNAITEEKILNSLKINPLCSSEFCQQSHDFEAKIRDCWGV